jgi:hypothetical protein
MKSLVAVVSFAAVLLLAAACGDGRQPATTPAADAGATTPAADAGEGLLFRDQQRFSVGETPKSVAVADLNGDGGGDIVTANTSSNDISVLLGNGDGSFQPQQRFAAGDGPISVAVVDLNGDGGLDIVTANAGPVPGSNDISVLLGNGDGSFQPQQRYPVGDLPESVAVADLNGDGNPDIVTANFSSSDVSVLMGNGDGSFQPQQRYPAGDLPNSVAVADLNGDGGPDIVTANTGSNDILVLVGNGDGSFQPQQRFPVGDLPKSVAVADLNGDGVPDIVTANAGSVPDSSDISVLVGNGDGSFQPQQRFPVGDGPSSVAVADQNGDGVPDIVTANVGSVPDSYGVSVLLGNGDGSFKGPQFFDAGDGPISVAVADLNGSGEPDIVTANTGSNDISVLLHRLPSSPP